MTLEGNLREIYHAAKFSEPHSIPLVSNLQGTHIYDRRYGWGRLWCWFYQIAEWISAKEWRLERLKIAVINTHTLFQKQLYLVSGHLKRYHDYLSKSGNGYSIVERDYMASRHAITDWNRSTAPIVKMMQRPHHEALEELFSKSFPKCPKSELKQLFCPPSAIDLYACQKIIDLEGITEEPLPLAIFKKVLRGKPLNAIESKDLDKWLWKLKKSEPRPKHVHHALETLAKHYQKKMDKITSKRPYPYLLEFYLEERGCTLFQNEDPKQLEWRQRLKKGTKIALQKSMLILGEEISGKSSKKNHTRVYHVEEQPNKVALVAQNTTTLPLRNFRMCRTQHYGLEPALLLDISKDGRVALMEKLKPLKSMPWTSSHGQLSVQDIPIVKALTSFLITLVSQNHTPSNFSPSSLMLTEDNHLKTLTPATKERFDFNAIEDFIYDSSGGNLTIFQYLMTKSGMATHKTAKFYDDLLCSSLKGGKTLPKDLAAIYKIADSKVTDRGIALIEKFKAIHTEICASLQASHPEWDDKLLQSKVTETLISCHRANKTASTLWPTLAKDALEKTSTSK